MPADSPVPIAPVRAPPGPPADLAAPCGIAVGRSPALFALLTAAHLTAGLAVALAPLPPLAAGVLVALVLASAVRQLRRHALRAGPQAVVGLAFDRRGSAELCCADGRRRRGAVLGSSVVSPRLTIVRVKPDGARWPESVLLLPDNCDSDAFRRVRVSLGWQVGPALREARAAD